MPLPRFFDRVHAAAGRYLAIDRIALEKILTGRVVALYCGQECEEDANARWIADLLANMLARLYPQILLSAKRQATLERLAGILRGINPSVDILTNGAVDIAVVIGTVSPVPPSAIYPCANGWVVKLLNQPPAEHRGPLNPYAAGVAAALAASEVFRRIFYNSLPARSRKPQPDFQLSLLDFGPDKGEDYPLTACSIGETAFIGLGAVGNSAIWALARHKGLQGKLFLIDHESVELSNLQRYCLTTDKDEKTPKVDLAARELVGADLHYEKFPKKLEDFTDSFKSGLEIPTACITVDNKEGRRYTQALLPRLVINGFTGDGAAGMSWHEFHREAACLACLYLPAHPGKSQTELVAEAFGLDPLRTAELWVGSQAPSDDELRAIAAHLEISVDSLEAWKGRPLNILYQDIICSATALDLKGSKQPATVPLSHQSVMAGILAAAELVKRTDPDLAAISQEEVFVMWEDVLSPVCTYWARPRKRVLGCICGDGTYQERYAEKWLR